MLTVHGLNHFYGGSHTLRGIDLEIPAGSCTAVLGRNGVGKTTFLRCLMGELPVRSGTVLLDGEEDRKSTRLNSSHLGISYAVFCLKKKKLYTTDRTNYLQAALSQHY